MLLALELFLVGELAAGRGDAILRLEVDGVGPDRLAGSRRLATAPRAARAAVRPETKPSR